MIRGIGVDSVAIMRFTPWQYFSPHQLLKVFTPQELEYCFAHQKKIAERLAVRFAAKEAFYKAASGYLFEKPLYYVLKNVAVYHDIHKKPYVEILWANLIGQQWRHCIEGVKVHLSLTHTDELATAFVIIEQVKNNPSCYKVVQSAKNVFPRL